LRLVFNSQIRMLLVRERWHFWSSAPNIKMLTVNITTIILFGIMGLSGIIIPGLLFNQVFIILGIAVIFMLCLDFLKYFVFRKFNI